MLTVSFVDAGPNLFNAKDISHVHCLLPTVVGIMNAIYTRGYTRGLSDEVILLRV